MIWLLIALSSLTIYLWYSRAVWKWRTHNAIEQTARKERKIALLEHNLLMADDIDRLWDKASSKDGSAQRALVARFQDEIERWNPDEQKRPS